MKNKHNVLIIGAGRIGAFFDSPDSKNILTHAHAFYKHPAFSLLGFVDINKAESDKAAGIWKCLAFNSIESVFSKYRVDIVVIAVPDEYHYKVLEAIASYQVKLVLAEKPITKTLQEAEKILSLYENKKIPIIVNYSRRFVPEFVFLKNENSQKLYGKFIGGVGYYGKGLLHNGSHMIDLLRFLFGEIVSFEKLSEKFDYYQDDPSISAVLTFDKSGEFYLQSVDCSLYTIFELDLLFENKRIRIINSGFTIEASEVCESSVFRQYKNITKTKEISTCMGNAMYHMVCNIADYLEQKSILACSGLDAYKTMKTCFEIKNGR